MTFLCVLSSFSILPNVWLPELLPVEDPVLCHVVAEETSSLTMSSMNIMEPQ